MIFNKRTQIPLVKDKVRHAGEPWPSSSPKSRYIAEDALDDIVVDLEPLEAVVDLEKALEPGAPLVHDDLDSNLAAHVIQDKGDYEAARSQGRRGHPAAHRHRPRRGGGDGEPRPCGSWDAKSQQLTIWDTTQAPIPLRNGLAAMFGLSEHQVRVIAPFVGGGFGPKIMMF